MKDLQPSVITYLVPFFCLALKEIAESQDIGIAFYEAVVRDINFVKRLCLSNHTK